MEKKSSAVAKATKGPCNPSHINNRNIISHINNIPSAPPPPRTYGVYGMMEWVALIPRNGGVVRVPFTGGSSSGYGVKPAVYTTANSAVMRMIEESLYFRSGKIKIVR